VLAQMEMALDKQLEVLFAGETKQSLTANEECRSIFLSKTMSTNSLDSIEKLRTSIDLEFRSNRADLCRWQWRATETRRSPNRLVQLNIQCLPNRSTLGLPSLYLPFWYQISTLLISRAPPRRGIAGLSPPERTTAPTGSASSPPLRK
jgi:hypothetical protein